ncbi:MAG: endospore germination permease [Peptococcaceae bacterium]|nr:endospore germination permease [Peptococcaceae bacterium]
MNKAPKPSVTSFQYLTVISGVLFANGIMSLPRVVASDAGRSAWLVVLAVGLVMSGITLLADKLASEFPSQDAAEWPKLLLGPILGRVWMSVYGLRAIALCLLTAQLYAGNLSLRLLHETPTYVFAIIILTLSLMAVLARIPGFTRYSEAAFFLSMPLILFVVIPFTKGNSVHLLPLIGDKPAEDLFKGALAASYSYSGFDFLWFVYPYLQHKASSKLWASGAVLLATGVYTFVTATAVMFFGIEKLNIIFLPTLSILSGIEVVFFERIDSLMMFVWLSTIVTTAASQLYTATRLTQGMSSRLSFAKTAALLSGLLLIMAINDIPIRQAVAFSDMFGVFDLSFIISSLLLFLFLASLRKGKGGTSPEK